MIFNILFLFNDVCPIGFSHGEWGRQVRMMKGFIEKKIIIIFFLLNIYWSRVLLKLRERWLKLICFARLFGWNDLEVMTFYLDRLLFHLQKKNNIIFGQKRFIYVFSNVQFFVWSRHKNIVWNLTALIELIKIVTQNCVKVSIL